MCICLYCIVMKHVTVVVPKIVKYLSLSCRSFLIADFQNSETASSIHSFIIKYVVSHPK